MKTTSNMLATAATDPPLEPDPRETADQAEIASPVSAREDDDPPASATAQQRAAAILEVLAGLRGPTEAATLLGVSVSHYYLLERKALQGLVTGCEAQPQGPRRPELEQQVARLERELETCRQECLRQAALVRVTQRAVGLPAADASHQSVAKPKPRQRSPAKPTSSKPASSKTASSRRRRRPTVRALRAARSLRGERDASAKNSSGRPS
jgi:hypothetical protein